MTDPGNNGRAGAANEERQRQPHAGDPAGAAGRRPADAAGQPPGAAGRPAGRPQSAASAQTDKLTRAADLLPSVSAPEGRRGDQGPGREVLGQTPRPGPASMAVPLPFSPGRSGFTPALQPGLRLRLGKRAARLRLEPGPAGDHPQDRQGPAALLRRRRVRRLHPGRRRRPGARARPGRRPADADPDGLRDAATRSPSTGRASRACSPASSAGPRHDTGISHWRTISRDNVTTLYGADPAQPDRRPGRPGQDLLLAASAGAGTTRATSRSTATPPRTAPASITAAAHEANRTAQTRARPDLPQDRPVREPPALLPGLDRGGGDRAPGRLDVHRRPRLRRSRQRAADAAAPTSRGRCAPTRSRPTAPGSRSAPTGASSGCCSSTTSPTSRRPARTAWSGRSTWSTPTSRPRPIRATRSTRSWSR